MTTQAKELLAVSEKVIGQHEQTILALRVQVALLLEAAKATVAWHNQATHGWYLDDLSSAEKRDFRNMISTLIAAIAQAEGRIA